MRITRYSLVLGALALVASASARPDLNAFLNKPALTTAQLVKQVRTDKEVADRYARHFAMPVAEVVSYLSSLAPATTKSEGVYTVYSVPQGGHLKAHTEIVKKGTKVFANANGKPMLIMKCGNPLTRGPRQPESFNENTANVEEIETLSLRDVSETIVASSPELVAQSTVLEPTVSEVPYVEIPPIEGGAPIPITPVGGGPSFGALLGGISLGGLVLGSLGGSTSGGVVPEPATALALGAGAALLLLRRRKH
ncbi:MAG TPA: PEP-CTERM sorting domain-containing protein [Fimbriimonadaceae bacterium]|nr:PEP-CTERM sorting domain-containing protein [Fimbriimonadaceae bacterium]